MILSIIIPVYNAEDYLEDCLNSILNQTFNDFELIIINDGSTDSSALICEKFKKKYANIKLLNQKNSGQGSARNKGVLYARGQFIWFIDADDNLPFINALNEIVLKLDRKDIPEIITFNTKVIFDDVSKNWINHYVSKINNMCSGKEYSSIHQIIPTGACSQWFNREFILKNNLQFKENIIFEDWFFNLKAFAVAVKVVGIPKVYYNYMKRENSTINGQMEYRHLFSEVQIINKVYNCYIENTFDHNYLSNRLEYEYSFLKKIYKFNNASKQDKINVIKNNINKLKIPHKNKFISEKIEKKIFEIKPILVLENIKVFNLISFYESKIRKLVKRVY